MEFYTGLTGKDTVLQTFDFGTLDTAAYASGDILTSSAIAVSGARYLGMGGTVERIILKETTGGTLQLPDLRFGYLGIPSLQPLEMLHKHLQVRNYLF